jgi:hypothetical protein
MKLSPEQMAKHTQQMADNIRTARSAVVAVGLPAEKVGGQVYGSGMTVVQVGAQHEYGAGVPRRSFLRVPFQVQKKQMDETTIAQFRSVFEQGQDAKRAMGLIGTQAVNIVKGAFTSRGYGSWPDISPSTKDAKGSSQVLIDTGTLRNSITYIVRGAE